MEEQLKQRMEALNQVCTIYRSLYLKFNERVLKLFTNDVNTFFQMKIYHFKIVKEGVQKFHKWQKNQVFRLKTLIKSKLTVIED